MIYVDIDIDKLNHFVAAIFSQGEVLIEPFKFTNDYDGFYLLFSKLASLDSNSIIIRLESTSRAPFNVSIIVQMIKDTIVVFLIHEIIYASLDELNIH